MSFGKKSVSAFNAKYKVRAYAVLADGSYVYSGNSSSSGYNPERLLHRSKIIKLDRVET